MKAKVKVFTITDVLENEVIDVVGSYQEAIKWVLDNRDEVYEFKGDGEVVIDDFTVWTEVLAAM